MINLTSIASSLARVALSDSTKPTIDRAMNVVSHIAGKVALQVNSSLLERTGRLNERQQKGLAVILDALRGKEPVTHVETHEGGGRFNLARAAFDVASVVWERDKSMRNVMSFLGVSDSKGNLLFSLGKTLAEAMVKPEPEYGKHNSEANYAFFSSNLKLNKLMNDIADQLINEIRQSNTDRVRRPTPGPSWRPESTQQQARPQTPPRTRPQAANSAPPPPPKAEPRAGAQRPSADRPHDTPAAGASAKVDNSAPAKPPVKQLYEHLGLSDMTADLSAVKKAYKKASLKNHPDKNVGNEAEATERFKVISKAFRILSDPELRKKYDNGLIDENGNEFKT
ncbi:type III secretion system effector HopI1 [Pseudomonas syringae]|uniref:type III secretion system effector HopI1 n=1 Tax=Pseudomonas syringae TaxID=317 RepID=UPI000C06D542|nr:type III secretion system effector HopI1 [Pseudomonas syringae]PHN75067.1 molecular chaperone DnaJ [Pseudomonas syringae]RMM42046.1 HopI1 [Pseudomonas syringae pv. aptata]RMS59300.1 HopI1 [Pseudomonas syringae pv. aceris]